MKALSLWQPWAQAIAVGVKRFETRSWPTSYRGPLAIHAAKTRRREADDFWRAELTLGRLPAKLPFGAIVAVCDVVSCLPSEEAKLQVTAIERLYGDYSPGRFAFGLENVRALPSPIPFDGKQGFFSVPDFMIENAFKNVPKEIV